MFHPRLDPSDPQKLFINTVLRATEDPPEARDRYDYWAAVLEEHPPSLRLGKRSPTYQDPSLYLGKYRERRRRERHGEAVEDEDEGGGDAGGGGGGRVEL